MKETAFLPISTFFWSFNFTYFFKKFLHIQDPVLLVERELFTRTTENRQYWTDRRQREIYAVPFSAEGVQSLCEYIVHIPESKSCECLREEELHELHIQMDSSLVAYESQFKEELYSRLNP